MKKFIYKILLISILFPLLFVLLVLLSSSYIDNKEFNNANTESNLLFIQSDMSYDIAFMGISHARNFSRYGNKLIMEKILGKSILNIGKGNGKCGVDGQLFYLKYFYSKNINIDTIIYVLSPPLLYADYLNRASNTFNDEPVRWDFISLYLKTISKNKYQRLLSYISSKLKPGWFLQYGFPEERLKSKLNKIDTAAINEGFNLAYLDGLNENIFDDNCETIEKTIQLAEQNNSKLIFIIPPAVFGKWPGHDRTLSFCKKMNELYTTDYYDFSESIKQPKFYFDHHHLNSEGVKYFTKHYLFSLFEAN